MDEITYMDCWHFIAPLIPLKLDTISMDVYVMTFHALKEAEKSLQDIKSGLDNHLPGDLLALDIEDNEEEFAETFAVAVRRGAASPVYRLIAAAYQRVLLGDQHA